MQQQKSSPGRRHRRSLGELVAASLTLIWGVLTALFFILLGHERTTFGNLTHALWVTQALCCGFGGLLALLRHRPLARLGLSLAALCLLILMGLGLWQARLPELRSLNLLLAAFLLVVATGYFFLGRWLGMQEETDE